MDGWMDGRTDGWTDGWIGGYTCIHVDRINKWMCRYIHMQINRQIDGTQESDTLLSTSGILGIPDSRFFLLGTTGNPVGLLIRNQNDELLDENMDKCLMDEVGEMMNE